MSASTTDKFTHVAIGTKTEMASPGHSNGSTDSINVVDASAWTDDTKVFFGIDIVDTTITLPDGSNPRKAGTYTEWSAILSGNTLSDIELINGDDQDYPAGATTRVYMLITAAWANSMVDGLAEEHHLDGTHGDVTADSLTYTGAFTGVDGSISSQYLTDPAAFYAYLAADYSGASLIQTTQLDTVLYDNASAFDTSAHTWPCPADGIYHFDGVIGMSGASSISFYAMFLVTHSAVTTDYYGSYTTTSGTNTGASSISRDFMLEAGDTVKLGYFGPGSETIKGGANITSLNGHTVAHS